MNLILFLNERSTGSRANIEQIIKHIPTVINFSETLLNIVRLVSVDNSNDGLKDGDLCTNEQTDLVNTVQVRG